MLKSKLANSPREILKMFPKPLAKFTTKSGKQIEIWSASMERFPELLEFYRRLTEEDTFINRYDTLNPELEKQKLKSKLIEIKNNNASVVWGICEGKIVGNANVNRISGRSWHVGEIGVMVDKDFRRDGIGGFLLKLIIEVAKKIKIKTVVLDVFAENEPAIELYKKFGFKKYGLLPNGLYRKGKYSDAVKMYKKISSHFAKATRDK